MKRVIYIATASLLVLSLLLFLASCGAPQTSLCSLLEEFCRAYPIDATVYCSCRGEGEDGYINGEMMTSIYSSPLPECEESAFVLHSRLDGVSEVGIFRCTEPSDRYYLIPILEERVEFLERRGFGGEGFVQKTGDLVIYGYVSDCTRALRIIESLV